jgi:EAL domain-containing protein (putative c-di-GMP-specific phosphodiesterase class I)
MDERGWKDITISVNVSPIQLSNQMFEDKVISIIEYYDVKPERLCFEVTETAVMQSFRDNVDKLTRLRKKGLRYHWRIWYRLFIIELSKIHSG